jgi:hypothetical protein
MIDPYDPKVHTEKSMCIRMALDAGLSQEDAEKCCSTCSDQSILEMDTKPSQNMSVNVSDVFPNLKFAEDDQPKIEGRQPENFEKCIITVMQVRQVDEPEATRVCHVLFNDPMFKHAMAVGDSWAIAEALHNYSLEHDSQWASYREHEAQKKSDFAKAVDAEMKKLREFNQKFRVMIDSELRPLAEKNVLIREETRTREWAKEFVDNEKLTVGNLYGKTKAQIIKEDSEETPQDSRSAVGNLFGKSHKEIVEEDKAQADQEEELKKLKRKATEGSN